MPGKGGLAAAVTLAAAAACSSSSSLLLLLCAPSSSLAVPSPSPNPAPSARPAPSSDRVIPAPKDGSVRPAPMDVGLSTSTVAHHVTTTTTTTTVFDYCQIYPGFHRCQSNQMKVVAESAGECASHFDKETDAFFAFSHGKQKCEIYTAEDCTGDLTQESQDWIIYGSCSDVFTGSTTSSTSTTIPQCHGPDCGPEPSTTTMFVKPDCTYYFGSDVMDDSLQITVIDPDVTDGYPTGDKTFMHHTGPNSACISPGPPAGCHRYFKVTYEGCAALADGSLADAAGNIDVDGLFQRSTGILNSCSDSVTKQEVFCFEAPADHPQECACPEETTTRPRVIIDTTGRSTTATTNVNPVSSTTHHIETTPVTSTTTPRDASTSATITGGRTTTTTTTTTTAAPTTTTTSITTTTTTTTTTAGPTVTDSRDPGEYCQAHQMYRKCSSKQSIVAAGSVDECSQLALAGSHPLFAFSEQKGKCELYLESDCLTTTSAAADWVVYQFAVCVQTTAAPGQGSCAGSCGATTDQGDYPYCHCDPLCSTYHDCCWDYLAECKNDSGDDGSGSNSGTGSDANCLATCYGMSCDEWEVNMGMACDEVESYGCDCSACQCSGVGTAATDPPPQSVGCTNTDCFGFSCDYWDQAGTADCADLESGFGCDCSGCTCAGNCKGSGECVTLETKGDGYCDDENNNCGCGWDGGDCCTSFRKDYKTRCTECVCSDPDSSAKSLNPKTNGDCQATCGMAKWVGDDFCDDNNNNCGCNWDGGDCCGPFSDDAYCTECICKDPDSEYTGTVCSQECGDGTKQADGYCDDENNVCGCDWDGGDCCLPLKTLKTDYCTKCLCLDPAESSNVKPTGGKS